MRYERRGAATVTKLHRKHRSFTIAGLGLAAGKILIVFLLALLAVQSAQYFRIRGDVISHREKIARLEERNRRMNEEISRLMDNEYIELLARKYLGLVKPGETIFQRKD